MPPVVFKKQMKEAFGISLSNMELSAAMSIFDRDNSGNIDVTEFQSVFFKMQREERTRMMRRRAIAKEAQKRTNERADLRSEALREALHTCRMPPFTSEHQRCGLKKLQEKAATFDYVKQKQWGGLSCFEETTTMAPLVFRQKLQKALGVHLSLEETAAMVAYFDSDGDGAVSTVEFKKTFFQLQRKAQDKKRKINFSVKLHNIQNREMDKSEKQEKVDARERGRYIAWQPKGSVTAR